MIDPTKMVCGNCMHYDKGDLKQGLCRRYPPTVAAAPVVRPTIAGAKPQIDWVVQGVYPPTQDQTPACGEFEFKVENRN